MDEILRERDERGFYIVPLRLGKGIYLCGGINGLNDSECRTWREVAKTLLHEPTLDPMRRDYRGREAESVDEIVKGDLVDIAECRAVLVNATRPSWGTAMEIVYAHQQHKPVVAFTEGASVSPWLRYHAAAILTTVDEACWLLNGKALL